VVFIHPEPKHPEDTVNKPNILIFMSDQQRGDSIPPYSKAKTPYLDKFCKEGIAFSKAFTISPHCCPSRATFFSGLYPSQHGVWNNVNVGNTLSRGLYEGVRLWSEDFNEAGYDMYFSGKWHVSDAESPLDRGFNKYTIVHNEVSKKPIKHVKPTTYEWARYENIPPAAERKEAEILRPGYPLYTHYGEKENPFNDEGVVNDAIKIIKERQKGGKPWCQYIGTLGPHDPYFVPKKFLDLYDPKDIKLPDSYSDKMTDKPSMYRRIRDRFDQLPENEQREAIRHYLAFCTYEDDLFGQVLKALDESGEAENTIVVYTSDHGDYAAEHGLWCKGLPCFDGAYHIPAAIRWPAGIKNPGRVVDNFINMADFGPTFLEAAGIDTKREFTGRSFMPFIKDEKPSNWDDVLFTQSNGNEQYGIQRSVRTKDWKLVCNGFDYDELYDLKADPGETKNLLAAGSCDPKYEKIVHDLFKKLWQFSKQTDDVCINGYIMVSLATIGPGVALE
jgi:arylsulfatase A-like enzyme